MTLHAPFLTHIEMPPQAMQTSYPFNIPLANKGLDLKFATPVTLICGENGSGKSTLIEAVAAHCGFGATGGNRNHAGGNANHFDVWPLLDHMKFSWKLRVGEGFFMRAESFFEFSGKIDTIARESGTSVYRGYGGKSLHHQSHGEAFLSLFTSRLSKKGIYLLDEPEAALSPQMQLGLLGILHKLDQTMQAQFVIVTHSPILMAYPKCKLLWIDNGAIYERNFKSTPHYLTMARFCSDPDSYIEKFLAS